MLIETSTTWVTGCTHFHVQFYAVLSNVILARGARFKQIIEVMMLNRSWEPGVIWARPTSHTLIAEVAVTSTLLGSFTFVSSQEHLWRSAQITQCQVVWIWCHPKRSAPRLVSWWRATLRLPESCRVLITPNLTKPHADHRNSNFTLNLSAAQSKWGTTLRIMDISQPGVYVEFP